jgi:hypothetical protein
LGEWDKISAIVRHAKEPVAVGVFDGEAAGMPDLGP